MKKITESMKFGNRSDAREWVSDMEKLYNVVHIEYDASGCGVKVTYEAP